MIIDPPDSNNRFKNWKFDKLWKFSKYNSIDEIYDYRPLAKSTRAEFLKKLEWKSQQIPVVFNYTPRGKNERITIKGILEDSDVRCPIFPQKTPANFNIIILHFRGDKQVKLEAEKESVFKIEGSTPVTIQFQHYTRIVLFDGREEDLAKIEEHLPKTEKYSPGFEKDICGTLNFIGSFPAYQQRKVSAS